MKTYSPRTTPLDQDSESSGGAMIDFTGLQAQSGEAAFPPMSEEEIWRAAQYARFRSAFLEEFLEAAREAETYDGTRHDPPEGVDPRNLAQAGWGVIFAEDTPSDVRDKLMPLILWRKRLATRYSRHRFRTFTVRSGTSVLSFLDRQLVSPSETARAERMPYYLLLVASPQQIPFEFQYELDLQYAVGRLHFEELEQYEHYVQNVLDAEKGHVERPRRLAMFSASNDDRASQLTSQELVGELAKRLTQEQDAWNLRHHYTPGQGTKQHLASLLGGGETPALLFAAAHGLRFPSGHPQQQSHQGALVCSDWSRNSGEELRPEHIFSANDLGEGGDLQGLVALLFACYGGATPQHDDFALDPKSRLPSKEKIAPEAFISSLAQGLLGRSGGAQAVIAHVDRTWTSGFRSNEGTQHIETFRNTLVRLMAGHPVGSATSRLDLRRGQLAARLRALDEQSSNTASERRRYADLWRQYRDTRNFVVLGDPAVVPALGGVYS